MKVTMTIEIEVDNDVFFLSNEEQRLWFENEILVGNGTLLLHSNEIGDTLGEVKKVSNVNYSNLK